MLSILPSSRATTKSVNVPPASIPMRMLHLNDRQRNALFSKTLEETPPDRGLHRPAIRFRGDMNDQLHLQVCWCNSGIEPDAGRRLFQNTAVSVAISRAISAIRL